ncbi:MAG: hypothetical protein V4474_00900 [Patescibacteria group bacterium]
MTQLPRTVKKTDRHTARWATLLLIVFMLGVQYAPESILLLIRIKEWLPDVLLLYMTIEIYETSQQSWTKITEFFWDNGLSFAGMIVGIVIFVLLFARPGYTLSYEHILIERWCTLACAFDFFLGLAIVFRITSAAREREEFPAH